MKRGAPAKGAPPARPDGAEDFEAEYPGASFVASRALRELEVVGALCERLVSSVARAHGLSHAALNALAVIEGNAEPIAAGEVAARMHITTGTTTSLLDTLERKGYVRRLLDPSDRRRVLVDVTPEAQAVLDRVLPEVQQLARAVMEPLGERTLQDLVDTLQRVRESSAAVPAELPAARRRRPKRLERP